MLEYGRLATSIGDYSETGLGTYHAYIDGTNLKVDFIPTSVGIATTGAINTVVVGLSSNTFTGIGTINLRRSQIEGRSTTISSSGSPGINTVADYPNNFDGAYFIVQVTDTTNSSIQLSEIVVVDDFLYDAAKTLPNLALIYGEDLEFDQHLYWYNFLRTY